MATPEAAPTPPRPAGGRPPAANVLVRHRNPLWRRSDSVRWALRALHLLGLACAAALCTAAALHLYQADRAETARYQARLHEVRAVALSGAVETAIGTPYTVQVRWTDAAGTVHQARAAVPGSTTAGSTVQLWLDADSRPAAAPATTAESMSDAGAIGLILLAGSALLLTATHNVLRSLTDRADLRRWERDWRLTEPAWSRHR